MTYNVFGGTLNLAQSSMDTIVFSRMGSRTEVTVLPFL